MKLRRPHLIVRGNRLRTINNFLTLVVVGLGIYIALTPFFPHILLWLEGLTDSTNGYRYVSQLAEDAGVNDNLAPPPKDNRLVIPKIQVDDPIIVTDDVNAIHQGVWHRPHTDIPDAGGNTVLVGHRFAYNNPAPFYHLDKLNVGDKFAIWWEGKEYIYEIFERVIVGPKAIEIEETTEDPIATLYTCTPMWTAKDRLVVKGRLVNTEALNSTDETSERMQHEN